MAVIPAGVYARRGAGMTSARQAAGNEPKEIHTYKPGVKLRPQPGL